MQARAALTRASSFRTKLYRDKLEGVLDEPRWAELDRSYFAEEQDARQQIERLSKTEPGVEETARWFKLLGSLPERFRGASDQTRADMLKVLGSNYILDGYNVDPVYVSPFDRVAEGVEKGDWRAVLAEVQTMIHEIDVRALVAA